MAFIKEQKYLIPLHLPLLTTHSLYLARNFQNNSKSIHNNQFSPLFSSTLYSHKKPVYSCSLYENISAPWFPNSKNYHFFLLLQKNSNHTSRTLVTVFDLFYLMFGFLCIVGHTYYFLECIKKHFNSFEYLTFFFV